MGYPGVVPLPTLLCLAFASGVASALAGRAELRVSPRPPLLTQSFLCWLSFAAFVLVPVSVYFYAFHGDWFLLYAIDVRRIPSALAMVGFSLEIVVGALGFIAGAALVRGQRESLGTALAAAFALAAALVVPVAADRLARVGSYAQYQGGFGLTPYTAGPLFHGTLAMSAFLVIGLAILLGRLHLGSRRA